MINIKKEEALRQKEEVKELLKKEEEEIEELNKKKTGKTKYRKTKGEIDKMQDRYKNYNFKLWELLIMIIANCCICKHFKRSLKR